MDWLAFRWYLFLDWGIRHCSLKNQLFWNQPEALEMLDEIYYLIENNNLWGPEGTFTFPNGNTYHKGK